MSDTEQEQEQVKAQILKQVEFYFSDSNLLSDNYLWKTSQANEGWVPIANISQFNRMKRYRPIELIAEALRGSKDLLEVSEDGELVRRKSALPPSPRDVELKINERSVFVEKLPKDATLEVLEEFFSKYGKVNQIRMKRSKQKGFEGSATVEFNLLEDAKKFLELDPKPLFEEKELAVISKVAYDEARQAKFGERRGSNSNGKKPFRGRGDKRGNSKRTRSPVPETKETEEAKAESTTKPAPEAEKKAEETPVEAPAAEHTETEKSEESEAKRQKTE
ncbi:unnamed protein product [Kuraishia capsulata CBS 1993]|uniref:HTH La-type RNA-binding domain-containing protein n=1 Tax=Kuraishia capsulata CBS 1993 TaxID=1382522 RepID=W6MUP8_9ASCO|nr:uncharacterized protein KUCA_T00001785001 [Kuraishia capsulata CBS 1993]CDK25815.1 unnamed protein product [Kuraishia capsulata CBS 1993]